MKWLARVLDTRAVRVIQDGERAFEHALGIRCAALRSEPAKLSM
jgi:hypothetical protein